MKVLFVLPTYFPEINGASIRMKGLITGLKQNNIECEVLTLGRKDEEYSFEGVKVYSVNKSSPVYSRFWEKLTKYNTTLYSKVVKRLRKLLKTNDYDVIHTRQPFHLYRAGLDAGREHKKPVVFESHRLLSLTEYELKNYNYIHYKLLFKQELKLLNASDYIITLSSKSRKNFRNHGVTSKIGVIGNSSYFSQLKKTKRVDVKKKYKLGNKKILLYSGTFRQNEGLELLVYLMKFLDNKYKLVLIGDKNDYYEKIKNLSEKLNVSKKILFTGQVSDDEITSFFKAAELFVYPRMKNSYHSDFIGLKVYDAIDSALPVITQKVGVLSDLIYKYKLGVNIDSNHAKKWAEKIKKVRKNDFQKNLKVYKNLTSWKNITKNLVKIYKSLF